MKRNDETLFKDTDPKTTARILKKELRELEQRFRDQREDEQPTAEDLSREFAYNKELAALQRKAMPRVKKIRESRSISAEDLKICITV